MARREWDGEHVIADLRGGDLHLLGDVAGTVLATLAALPDGATAEELALLLSSDPVDQDEIGVVQSVLENLRKLGLARPQP